MQVLLVDLNNFARYPTLAVGLLASVLRRDGIEPVVLSPLSVGIPGVEREPRVGRFDRVDQYLRHRTAQSAIPGLAGVRAKLAARRRPLQQTDETRRILAAFDAALAARPDVVLISAYLMYQDVVRELASRCASRGVPLGLGGPYFAQPEVIDAWRTLPGVAAVLGGEGEAYVTELVGALAARRDPGSIAGVSTPTRLGGAAPPLAGLDALPFPEFEGFPWSSYPNRLIPVLTGRGCGWGRCRFCSDVTSAMGRSFRSRSAANVLAELAHQSRRYDSAYFVFTDLKLNSSLATWYGLVEGIQRVVPGARFVGAVHADGRAENGLEAARLKEAAAAGMVRLTTGLESGSQRVLDLMDKGTLSARIEQMLHDAWEAGISTRLTMIVGYPGEEPADVEASAAFLARSQRTVGRVLLNRFAMVTGTRVQRRMRRGLPYGDRLEGLASDPVSASWPHRYAPARSRAYRRALWRLLGAVHAINRRPLSLAAKAFEGVM